MAACEACQNMPLELFTKPWSKFFLHPSLTSLLASASAGCKFCRFLQRRLAIDSENVLPQPSKILLFSGYPPGTSVTCQIDEPEPFDIETPRSLHTSFQFSVEPFEGKRRPITGDTRSEETFRQMKIWLDECGAGHTKCRQASADSGFVPTRLIDLQPMTATSNSEASPKLILTADLISKHVDYITLSYARSSDVSQDSSPQVQTTTTEENLNEHVSSGIPSSKLPLTIREGIEIAQRLKIRYIWDFSLCIIQDSPADWKLESPLIPEIFAHAYVTIAASASANIHEGFFRDSESNTEQDSAIFSVSSRGGTQEVQTRVQIIVMKKQHSWGSTFQASPLNKRAWVMQEREFSPRILHFAETQVLWECRLLRSSEGWPERNVPNDEWLPFPPRLLDGLQEIDTMADDAPAKRNDMWVQTVVQYSARNLKNAEDKFPALASLAQVFAGNIIPYDHYIAGFWKQDLVRTLSWGCGKVGCSATVTNTRHERYVAPTWSWASVHGLLDFGYLRTIDHSVFSIPEGADAPEAVKLMPKILGVHLPRVTPADDPFGRLREGAELCLRGYIVRAVLGYDGSSCGSLGQLISLSMADESQHERDSKGRTEFVGTMFFDVPSERAALNPREEVLVLYVHPWKSPSFEYGFKDGGKGICAVGIALVRTGEMSNGAREGKYKRVGHVRPLSVQCFEGAREQEIVIV